MESVSKWLLTDAEKDSFNIIIELNSIKDVNLIYVGQKLLLPVAESE